jgi:uncharacterized damage-inducible protein DinB
MELTNIDTFLQYYSRIKHRTERLFDCIPEEKIEWQYAPGKFSIGDIIRHLALTERYMYVSTYSGCGEDFAKGYTKTIQLYQTLKEESFQLLSQLDNESLQKKCVTPAGTSVTVWKFLRAMVEHEVHHRAVLYTYLNMLNITTPPIFGLTEQDVIAGSE